MAEDAENQSIWEAMEACRPGSQDLVDPQFGCLVQALAKDPTLAVRYGWLQAVDAQVASAFGQVVVPADLQARILENLRSELAGGAEAQLPGGAEVSCFWAAQEEDFGVGQKASEAPLGGAGSVEPGLSIPLSLEDREETGARETSEGRKIAKFTENRKYGESRQIKESGEIVPGTVPSRLVPAGPSSSKKRGRWLVAAALVASASMAAAIFLLWPPSTEPPLSLATIQNQALWFAMGELQQFSTGPRWEGPTDRDPFPFSRWVRSRADIRVRKISGLLGREGLAYDLQLPEGSRATLYVVPVFQSGAPPVEQNLPSEPPRYDQTARTGGFCAGGWQEDGFLYMLVVHRDSSRAYYQFFTPQQII